jgi:hypothetical protein
MIGSGGLAVIAVPGSAVRHHPVMMGGGGIRLGRMLLCHRRGLGQGRHRDAAGREGNQDLGQHERELL